MILFLVCSLDHRSYGRMPSKKLQKLLEKLFTSYTNQSINSGNSFQRYIYVSPAGRASLNLLHCIRRNIHVNLARINPLQPRQSYLCPSWPFLQPIQLRPFVKSRLIHYNTRLVLFLVLVIVIVNVSDFQQLQQS